MKRVAPDEDVAWTIPRTGPRGVAADGDDVAAVALGHELVLDHALRLGLAQQDLELAPQTTGQTGPTGAALGQPLAGVVGNPPVRFDCGEDRRTLRGEIGERSDETE